jgi:TRAP-type C4-dicarboxylate transport system substrate-binding protein
MRFKPPKLAIAASLAMSALTAVTAYAQTKWDMPTPYPDTNFHTKNVKQFTEEVAGLTKGALQITVHSNGSLIKHPDIKRAVQTGQVPIGELLVSVQANESPLYAFDSNPFFAANYDAARKLWTAAKPALEKRLNSQGLTLLYSVPWQPQGIYTKKPIESIADLKGAKFRTYSPTTSRFAELMGAIPTTVQVPEVPQAFRTGMVDAMITAATTGVDTQAWDYLTHYYDVQAMLPHNMVIVNTGALKKLDPAVRDRVMKAAAEAEERGWKISVAENDRMVKLMADKGIKITKPSEKLRAELTAIGEKMAAEWIAKAGADGAAIAAAYRK